MAGDVDGTFGNTDSVNEAVELQGSSPERLTILAITWSSHHQHRITHHNICVNSSIICPVVAFSINIQNTMKASVIVPS